MILKKLITFKFMFDFYMHLEIEPGFALMKFDNNTVTILEYDGVGWDSISIPRSDIINSIIINDNILNSEIIKAVFIGEK